MVKQGYKETEIGVIPEDWDIIPANKLMKIETGSKNTEDKKEDGKFPFFVRSSKIENIDTYSYDCEAVLTAGDGVGTGKVFHYYNGKFDVHQRVYVMYEFDDIIGKYFYYYFSENFRDEVAKYTAKSSVDSVRKNMIADMLIPVMSNSEQREITKVLSDIDSLIDSLEKLVEKKKDIKQGVMQKLLTGKQRLPGFTGEWENEKLKYLVTMFAGGTPSRQIQEYYNGEIKWASVSDITNVSKYIVDTAENISKEGLNSSSAKLFPANTILFAMYASIGKCCISLKPISSSQAILGLYDFKNCNMEYLYYWLVSREKDFIDMGQSGTQSNLSKKIMEAIEITLPQIEEQEAIASVLSDMDEEIEALEQKLEKYSMLKQGMMQQLLTGKIRLV